MARDQIYHATFGPVAHTLLRVLIASYFIASALAYVPGTTPRDLLQGLEAGPIAEAALAGTMFTLAFMVMIGMWTRLAALLLGLIICFSSFIHTLDVGMVAGIGTLWRDIALVAALMLTYADAPLSTAGLIRRTIRPRRVTADPERRKSAADRARTRIVRLAAQHGEEVETEPEVLNIFADIADDDTPDLTENRVGAA